MSTEPVFSLRRVLPSPVYSQLGQVLQQTAEATGEAVLVLTEAEVSAKKTPIEQAEQFMLVVSTRFSGLLLAEPVPVEQDSEQTLAGMSPMNAPKGSSYQVGLTFSPEVILTWLAALREALPSNSVLRNQVEQASQQLQPNDDRLQSEFTLRLVEVLTASAVPPQAAVSQTGLSRNDASCDLVIARALQKQLELERLLNQVTAQIRESMDLPVILETAVRQVQQLLQVDRVVIYEFEAPTSEYHHPLDASQVTLPSRQGTGRITYEALATKTLTSVLHMTEEAYCFTEVTDYRNRYRKGCTLAVDDIEYTFAHSRCLIELLRRAKVRAKLVVPIMVQEELWGLLIAHQCFEPRYWQQSEKTFMQRVAEHLAIAIHQAYLYAQLKQEKQMLAQHVDKRTQELCDALDAAQTANLAKTEFLATMSHELRTPLTCIIGMAETLLRLPPGAAGERFLSAERRQDYLKTIQRSGEHLLELINDILDLSQVEAGKLILDIQEFSLSQLVTESVRMLEDKASQRQIRLKIDIELEPRLAGIILPSVDLFTADPRRIKQILLNLLSNAIKFTPAGGLVTLRVWREDQIAIFQVQDTGIGISDNQRPLLFNKFQQLDMSHQRKYEGTGLGLALTKQLVELQQGWIEVESTVNVGSTFTVSIPKQSRPPEKRYLSNAATEMPSDLRQGRIVLIEDNEATATLICNLLTTAGYQVVWMIDGSTVLPQVKILQPVAVLLSTHLVGVSAAEILQSLRRNSDTSFIPILILASEASDDEINWLALGASDSLSSSIPHPEQLLDKVAQVVANRRK